jgi:hypothetical protein
MMHKVTGMKLNEDLNIDGNRPEFPQSNDIHGENYEGPVKSEQSFSIDDIVDDDTSHFDREPTDAELENIDIPDLDDISDNQ